jgi:hypothetical protein
MVGVIGPLVEGKRQLRDPLKLVALFGLGAVVGAALTGALVGLLGAAAQNLASDSALAIAVGAAGCVLLLADLGVLGLRTPSLRRQTSSTWYRDLGPRTAWAFWGVDLGLGFSTIRLGSLYWFMVLFVAAFVSPPLAPLVLAFYGLGLCAALTAVVVTKARKAGPVTGWSGLGLLRAARSVRLASDALLGLASIAIVVAWGTAWW